MSVVGSGGGGGTGTLLLVLSCFGAVSVVSLVVFSGGPSCFCFLEHELDNFRSKSVGVMVEQSASLELEKTGSENIILHGRSL